jgi:general secretion pathway protein D
MTLTLAIGKFRRGTLGRLMVLLAVAALAVGCAAGRAFRQGELATRAGNLDQAVAYYRAAVQASPDNPNYKIALQRAMLAASRLHLDRAREFEENDQLEAARGEYRLASEYDPQNGFASTMVASLDQRIRDRIEAARPRPLDQLREQARAAAPLPLLNPAVDRLNLRFQQTRVGDILDTIANASGISITTDRDAQANIDRATTIQIDDLSVDQALNMIMSMNQLSYKIINQRSIFIFPDTVQKHAQYDDQVVQIFYVANADVTELAQLLSAVVRFTGVAIQPIISPNAKANTITARATPSVMQIIERIIQQNDKPRAEIIFDVEILEVDRNRVKQYGLNLTDYAIGGIFSPVIAPGSTTTPGTPTDGGATPTTPTTSGTSTAPSAVTSPPPFNLNTISQGVSTTDFYLAVPAAVVRFLESDSNTRIVAKPQVRGADGSMIRVNLGQQVPIVSTSYTPIATGGAGVNPLNSFSFRDVGINIELTPRVTAEGDISVDLMVESSTQGPDRNVAGTNYPTFGSRRVTTRLRLRDGESNLLAGLLREDETNGITGAPGAIRVPILKQLFSSNSRQVQQTDLVMLLTPHIIRTSEINASDLQPIYIGSQQNLGVGGPPPLIAPTEPAVPAQPPAPQQQPPQPPPITQPNTIPGGVTVAPPPGTSPIPGTVVVPPPAPAAPPPAPAPAPAPAPEPAPAPGPAAAPETPPPAAGVPPPPGGSPQTPTVGAAQVIATPPGTTFRVGGGPYTVPISVVNVSRLSTVSITITFDPAILRVRSVQEGSFMRSGGAAATFTNQVAGDRVDITITRAGDAIGATGTGLLGAVLFDAVGPGTATLTLSGIGTGPGGTSMGLQFRPVTVTVQR